MGSGLLTGRMTPERVAGLEDDDWRKSNPDFQQPALGESIAVAAQLDDLGRSHGRSAGAMACAWVLGDPRVTAAIVGFRSPEQVRDVLGVDGFALSVSDFAGVRRALQAQ
jgi:aryl-alcohol dehydrogenase-like predicted oxidoreductase